jgi:hypothetical protein
MQTYLPDRLVYLRRSFPDHGNPGHPDPEAFSLTRINRVGQLLLSTGLISVIALLIGFTGLAGLFSMARLPLIYLPALAAVIVIYLIIVQILKPLYVRKYQEWI